MDEFVRSEVDTDVADASPLVKEHQVAGPKIPSGHGNAVPYLLTCVVRQYDAARSAVDVECEPRAVEAAARRATPNVAGASLRESFADQVLIVYCGLRARGLQRSRIDTSPRPLMNGSAPGQRVSDSA